MRLPLHVARGGLLLGLLWLACGTTALASDLIVASRWHTTDGLPLDSASALALDADGYLWIATSDGLARFDGGRFQQFNRDSSPALPENRVARLHALAGGGLLVHFEGDTFGLLTSESYQPIARTTWDHLVTRGADAWFVTGGGIAHWRAEQGVRLVLPVDASALHLVEYDADHGAPPTLLIGTRTGRVLRYRPESGDLEEIAADPAGQPVLGLAAGPDGELAYGRQGVLVHRPPASAAQPERRATLPTIPDMWLTLAWTPRGFLLNPTGPGPSFDRRGLLVGDALQPIDDPRLIGVRSTRLALRDRLGRVWSNEGLQLRRDGDVVYESAHPIYDFTIDRYGQIWLATLRGGLVKLIEPVLETVGAAPGTLVDSNVYLVQADGDDGLLVGSYLGLDRYDLRNDRWQRLRHRRSLAALRDGDSLLVGDEVLCAVQGDGVDAPCTPPAGLAVPAAMPSLLHRDRRGGLWVGAMDGIRHRQPDGRWIGPLLPGVRARGALELQDGSLLLATTDRGVLQVDIDQPMTSMRVLLDETGGLPSNRVRDLFLDSDDSVLIGLEDRGLCSLRLGAGLQRCLGVADGLPHHSVHRMIADDQGRLWVNSNDGIYALDRRELRAVLRGDGDQVGARRFGVADGMRSSEGNGGVNSAGARSADGRIWFPTQRGVVMVRPERIRAESYPLTATIEPIDTVDSLDSDAALTLPPDRRLLRVWLSAIALRGSGDVQLRYRLDGREWIGTRPGELVLDGMRPGEHRLEVAARYADGDWNSPASLAFVVPHRLTEMRSVRLGVVLLLLLTVIGLFQRNRGEARRLSQRVEERTASLHSALRTVRAQAEQIHAAADRRQQWYLTISHELRTPLTSLLGPLDQPQPQPTSRQLERMRRSALQMRNMIEELLLLERLDHEDDGRFHPERIAALIRRTIELQRSALEAAGITFELDLGGAPDAERLRVDAEAAQLERAIGTLIGNAITHAGEGPRRHGEGAQAPRVRLILERHDDHVLLHVDDDGPGIPPAERERVLRPFARGDAASPEGFGLGLALCQRIVLHHRGRLEIGDSPLGGARITLQLPLLDVQAAPPAVDAAVDAPVVLVVDDDDDIRAYLGELLAPHYQLLLARNGSEGLRMALAELPDAIVSDINMPELDGIEMVRRLRAEPETSVIPVIFLTAYGQQEIEARAFAAGGDQFLAKPFRPDQVLLRLARLFAYRKDLLARHPAPSALPAEGAAAGNNMPRRPTLLDRLNHVLAQRIGDPELDVDELCRELGVSRATLYRRLEGSSGQTPTDYIRSHRLDRAASLLRDSDEQVSAIAYAVGFKRLSAFTRSFTARFGCAPSMYRRSNREAGNAAG